MTSSDYEMLDLVDDLEGRRLAVVGDVMLDVWLEGPVKRVSPEAPVPVVELASTRQRLGGAANVAAVIGALGGSASVLGLVGDDGGSQLLSELLEEAAGPPCSSRTRPAPRPGRPVSCPALSSCAGSTRSLRGRRTGRWPTGFVPSFRPPSTGPRPWCCRTTERACWTMA